MATLAAPLDHAPSSRGPTATLLRKLFGRKIVLIGAIVIAVMALAALAAPWITPYDPMALKVLDRLQSPRAAHWFGTDELGRDVFSRVVFGARYSLMISALVVVISVAAGVLLGLAAGFFRRLDAPLMRLVDAMISYAVFCLKKKKITVLGDSMT